MSAVKTTRSPSIEGTPENTAVNKRGFINYLVWSIPAFLHGMLCGSAMIVSFNVLPENHSLVLIVGLLGSIFLSWLYVSSRYTVRKGNTSLVPMLAIPLVGGLNMAVLLIGVYLWFFNPAGLDSYSLFVYLPLCALSVGLFMLTLRTRLDNKIDRKRR